MAGPAPVCYAPLFPELPMTLRALSAVFGGFTLNTCTTRLVHVLEQATDMAFIGFHDTRELLVKGLRFDGRADPVQHEPRGFLGHFDGAVEFVGRDAVLAVGNHPDREEPLAQANGRVFKDRPDTDGELLLAALALPELARGDERLLGPVAVRAEDAFRPTQRHGEREGVVLIGEERDRLLKGLRESRILSVAFGTAELLGHTDKISPETGCVKYINTRWGIVHWGWKGRRKEEEGRKEEGGPRGEGPPGHPELRRQRRTFQSATEKVLRRLRGSG
jgi:hypothetical protein